MVTFVNISITFVNNHLFTIVIINKYNCNFIFRINVDYIIRVFAFKRFILSPALLFIHDLSF